MKVKYWSNIISSDRLQSKTMSVASLSLRQSRYDVTSQSADSFRYCGTKPTWRTGSEVLPFFFFKKKKNVFREHLTCWEEYLKLLKDLFKISLKLGFSSPLKTKRFFNFLLYTMSDNTGLNRPKVNIIRVTSYI